MVPWLIPLLLAGGQAAGAAASSASNRGNREASERQAELDRAAREKADLRQTALAESTQNPFRQQLAQARAIALLDRLATAQTAPRTVTPAGPYAGYVPQMSGGVSYELSDTVQGDAGLLRDDVRRGRTAPTMTRPSNYGRTATLDLTATNPLAAPVPSYDPVEAEEEAKLRRLRRREILGAPRA